MIVKSSQTFVSSSSSLFRQDLSRWCGGVTSWYRGLFYTRASIHLPLHTDRRGTENNIYLFIYCYIYTISTYLQSDLWHPNAISGPGPYLRPGDLLVCEVTLAGTDYKRLLYTSLNTSQQREVTQCSQYHSVDNTLIRSQVCLQPSCQLYPGSSRVFQ